MLGALLLLERDTPHAKMAALRYVLFFLYWLVLLHGTAAGYEAMALILLLPLAAWSLYRSSSPAADCRLIGLILVIGPPTDMLLKTFGLIEYLGWQPVSFLPPLWIYAAWINFALIANHCFYGLAGKPLQAAALGAVVAPIAYALGVHWGAAQYAGSALAASLVLSLAWAMILTLIFWHPKPD